MSNSPVSTSPTSTATEVATPIATSIPPIRTRPAFEKLLIGPAMVFGEMITGGHYLEVLRLGKQMTVGRHNGPSYQKLHMTFVKESGFVGAFYRGFLPWGLVQCAKGVPVLFVQHESQYQLVKYDVCSYKTAEKISGVFGGTAQAIFVCPFQKLKVSVVACEQLNSLSPIQASVQVIKQHGVTSLFDGILPMIMRRSLDWGIRFSVSSEVKNYIIAHKIQQGETSPKLSFMELIICGLIGGSCSAMTHPIDNIITNSQKPMYPGARRDIVSVSRRMMMESGVHAFTRGWAIKVLDNAYHMAWMYGVGTVVYEQMTKALSAPAH